MAYRELGMVEVREVQDLPSRSIKERPFQLVLYRLALGKQDFSTAIATGRVRYRLGTLSTLNSDGASCCSPRLRASFASRR